MELGLEEAEAAATQDELAAERTTSVATFTRKHPSRQPSQITCRASA